MITNSIQLLNLLRTAGCFLLCKKVLPLPKNNNETIMTLLVYPQDRKQAEILTGLFREMKVRFEYDDISYEEIDRAF